MRRPSLLLLCTLGLLACNSPTPPPQPADTTVDNTTVNVRRSFHSNGQVDAEVPMVDGLQHGTLTAYFPDGRVKAIQGWQHGRPFGEHKVFDADGALVYHAVSTYEDIEEAQFLAYSVLLSDSTKVFSTANRLVITDMNTLLGSVRVLPGTALRFGTDNLVRIEVPNVPSFSPSVQYATISKGGHPQAWTIRPTVPGKDVVLSLMAQVNDTTLEFAPVVLKVTR
jgi:hypothetical protein